ncbi:MAG: DUF1501 domain-containing protein [Polyangia bacterium]
MSVTRRDALLHALFGAGWVGLRSLATGLPIGLLTASEKALAQGACSLDQSKAQFIVLSTSASGDPMNANMPGTYVGDIAHPPANTGNATLDMTPTMMNLGGKMVQAAKPWASLPASVLANACFIHHSTLNNSHTNQSKVQRLMGAISRQEMLMSYLAKQLAPCLGTVQREPVTVGANGSGELLTFEGRVLPNLSPTGLKTTLLNTPGVLTNLQKVRDADLDRLNALFKASGNTAQKAYLDRLARSQSELRSLSDTLLSNLDAIRDNGPNGQIIAAGVMVAMKVSPVVSIHLPFGGDNHTDANLANEARQHVTSCAQIGTLFNNLTSLGVADKTTFVAMNVFGRTLRKLGTAGRDHWGSHHVTVVIGKPFKAGVIGGVELKGTTPTSQEWYATPINSTTGASDPAGDITVNDSLAAVGKTIGKGVGVPDSELGTSIMMGKVISAALA